MDAQVSIWSIGVAERGVNALGLDWRSYAYVTVHIFVEFHATSILHTNHRSLKLYRHHSMSQSIYTTQVH